MLPKPFNQLFNSDTNEILDPVGLARQMFPGVGQDAPEAGGSPRNPGSRPRPVGQAALVNRGSNGMYGLEGHFNMAQAIAGQHGAHLGGMANQINQAMQDENDSRVAQMRERQRQEHEKELMRMRMEAQRRSDEATLIRSILGSM